MQRQIIFIILLAFIINGCGKKNKSKTSPLPANAQVLAVGDSLTFGYGASSHESWPAQLAQISGFNVANFGVNGDTSQGVLERLPNLLSSEQYDAIIIGIGGNDMIKGLPEDAIFSNLQSVVRIAKQHTNYVAVLGVPEANPLRMAVGSLKDSAIYAQIAESEDVLLLNDIYADVLSDSSLKSDTIHANAKGYKIMAQQIVQKLKKAGWYK